MKKVSIFIVLCFAIICMGVFTGCSNMLVNLISKNMSDYRINYFEGEDDNFVVSLSCGHREKNFAYDGISTEKVECGVIELQFKTDYSYSAIAVNLKVDGKEQEYVLERSPFEPKYMVDIEEILTEKNNIEIGLKNSPSFVKLNEISKNFKISKEKALEIGVNEFKGDLENLYEKGKIKAEGYLKIVSKLDFNQKFWFFSFVDIGKNSKSVLIDCDSGKVIKSMTSNLKPKSDTNNMFTL